MRPGPNASWAKSAIRCAAGAPAASAIRAKAAGIASWPAPERQGGIVEIRVESFGTAAMVGRSSAD